MQTIGVTVLLLVLSLILYVAAKELAGFGAAQNLTFIWGLAGGGFFLSLFCFRIFQYKCLWLFLSHITRFLFEKWLCGILISGILYPLSFYCSII